MREELYQPETRGIILTRSASEGEGNSGHKVGTCPLKAKIVFSILKITLHFSQSAIEDYNLSIVGNNFGDIL
jgi:hypothetical protein